MAVRIPSRPNRGAGLLGAMLLGLALAGCGGSGPSAVIAQANAICENAVRAQRAQPATIDGVSAAARIVRSEVGQLRAIKRPAQRSAVLDAFLRAEGTVADQYERFAAAERTSPTRASSDTAALVQAAERASTLARRYGISRCAAAGATVGSP